VPTLDILTVLRTILRRWLVVVPIVLATAAIASSVGGSIKPEYGMSGTVLLVGDGTVGPTDAESAPVVTAPVLAELLRSPSATRRMFDAGATVPYTVEVDPVTSIVRVTAAGRDGSANVRTVEIVLERLDDELALVEETAELPEGRRAQVKVLVSPGGQPGGGLPSASGSAFLIPAGARQPNPYPPDSYTTRILTETLLSAESRRRISDRAGGVAEFELTAQPRDTAPILTITARGLDVGVTEATYEAVIATADSVLSERQASAGVEPKSRTRIVPLNSPAGATETSGTVVKSVATVVGLGLIVAATAAILTESFVVGRRKRREERAAARLRESVASNGSHVGDGEDAQRVILRPTWHSESPYPLASSTPVDGRGADGYPAGGPRARADELPRDEVTAFVPGADEQNVVPSGDGHPSVSPPAKRRRRRSPEGSRPEGKPEDAIHEVQNGNLTIGEPRRREPIERDSTDDGESSSQSHAVEDQTGERADEEPMAGAISRVQRRRRVAKIATPLENGAADAVSGGMSIGDARVGLTDVHSASDERVEPTREDAHDQQLKPAPPLAHAFAAVAPDLENGGVRPSEVEATSSDGNASENGNEQPPVTVKRRRRRLAGPTAGSSAPTVENNESRTGGETSEP
jgi:hypothetical protein